MSIVTIFMTLMSAGVIAVSAYITATKDQAV